MDNNVKVCRFCNNINSADADKCRVCGAPLRNTEPIPANNNANAANNSARPVMPQNNQQGYAPFQNQNGGYAAPPYAQTQQPYTQPVQNFSSFNPNINGGYPIDGSNIYGIPTAEVSMFVGEKSADYIPKFMTMAYANKKTGFNILVFLLGFLISPVVASFWFFHRRMNKIGAAVFGIGLVLCILTTSVTLGMFLPPYVDELGNAVSSSEYGDDGQFNYNFDYGVNEENAMKIGGATLILMVLGAGSLALTVITSIFANRWYLDHTVRRIKQIKQNPNYTAEDIIYSGGTRTALWAVLLILFAVAFIALVTIFSAQLVNGIFEIAQ